MPRYNHDRADGPTDPCLICLVEEAMEKMRVVTVGRIGDYRRWSRTDFITDLVDHLDPRLKKPCPNCCNGYVTYPEMDGETTQTCSTCHGSGYVAATDLLQTIKEVHSQHADDLCWMDIDRIFVAAGLPVPDRKVGDKKAMKRNCDRFIDIMCQAGGWQSYVELEAERDIFKSALERILAWDNMTAQFKFDYGSKGEEDRIKAICREALRWAGSKS